MDLQQLTQKMNEFVAAKGWYASGSIHPQTLRNLAISLSLEASEVLEHFQWQDEPADQEALAEELADVALYLLQISCIGGIDLEKAILRKLEKNSKREWDQKELK